MNSREVLAERAHALQPARAPMLYMMLLIPFLLCLGVVASSFLAGFTPTESRPAFYRDEPFRKRMEWSFLPAIGFALGLVNINLKYTLPDRRCGGFSLPLGLETGRRDPDCGASLQALCEEQGRDRRKRAEDEKGKRTEKKRMTVSTMPERENRELPVLMLYNLDPAWGREEQDAALAATEELIDALRAEGHPVTPVRVDDLDLRRILSPYDPSRFVVLNWCEALPGIAHSEALAAETLEEMGFAYSGSPPPVLRLSGDKEKVKDVLLRAGVPTPQGCVCPTARRAIVGPVPRHREARPGALQYRDHSRGRRPGQACADRAHRLRHRDLPAARPGGGVHRRQGVPGDDLGKRGSGDPAARRDGVLRLQRPARAAVLVGRQVHSRARDTTPRSAPSHPPR